MRLDRYLANLQYGTRSDVKKMIKANRVALMAKKFAMAVWLSRPVRR
nr:RNA-binding protein [Lacticaseibacillus camelliae]